MSLSNFVVTEVSLHKQEVTLNLPSNNPEASSRVSYRVRLVDVPDPETYVINKKVSVSGTVVATRQSLLAELVSTLLGNEDPEAEHVSLSENLSLPNPLKNYDRMLWDFLTVYISKVHGDLNLENILVDPKTREIELIDFATVHRGHAITDLLRLEVEVVVMLLGALLRDSNLPADTVYTVYEQLHQIHLASSAQRSRPRLPDSRLEKPFRMLQAIREVAQNFLFDKNDWREYYQGVILYLLGTLKFEVLDPALRQTAFWGAATIQHLLETPDLPLDLAEPPRMIIEPPYGTMNPNSPLYIERDVDQICKTLLKEENAVTLYIRAPWQMGKSSLMRRTSYLAQEQYGKICVYIDFQNFQSSDFDDEDMFFKRFCLMLDEELGITSDIDKYWSKPLLTNIIKCTNYLTRHIVPRLKKPLIIAMDELERTMTSTFRTDFFGMLRTWHNKRHFDKNLAQVSLFLSSSTDPFLLIDNPNQSPFNVAELLSLRDFSAAEVRELNRHHASAMTDSEVDELFKLLDGHPFLTRLALYLIARRRFDFKTLMAQATDDNGPFGTHLRHYHQRVMNQPDMREAALAIIRGQATSSNNVLDRMREAGLIKRDGNKFIFRNQLYARYFKERFNA